MTNLESVLDITLATKVCIVKAMMFRNINNLRYADDTTLMAVCEEELKSLLMKVKDESEKSRFKTQYSKSEDHSIPSHHFMANR